MDNDELLARLDERVDGIKDSITLARSDMDRRLEGMNEFREAMNDLSTRMITRSEFAVEQKSLLQKLEDAIDAVRRERQSHESHDDERFDRISQQLSIRVGSERTTQRFIAAGFTIIGFLIAIIAVIVSLN